MWLVSLLVSCAKDGVAQDSPRRQVLLVYLGGDNDLGGEAREKLEALRNGWSGDARQRIVIYIDRAGAGSELFEVATANTGGNTLRAVGDYGDENSASAAVFARVITDVRRLYPADSYRLLVFSHATGWLPPGAFDDPYGFGRNTGNGKGQIPSSRAVIRDGDSWMELTDFAAAIPDGLFDCIVFETCFMAGVEVAYELRHKAPWILASSAEIVAPGFTPLYSTVQATLFADTPQELGEQAFRHVQTYSDYRNSATYSLIRTSELEILADYVRRNCDPDRTVDVSGIQRFDRKRTHNLFFDFGDYYTRLLKPEADPADLARIIGACVSWKAATPGFMNQQGGLGGFTIESHSGLTAYIPHEQFVDLNHRYRNLQWSAAIRGEQ